MKTVTQNFVDAQKQPSPAYVRQIWYKRRYWVESSKSYAWETNWTQYTEDNIVDVSDITWQLDITTLNEFKTSNVTITVQNLQNQWLGSNPYGVFKKDSVSPVYGYQPYWTKIQIRCGLLFGTPETTEVIPVFTGVSTDFNLDSATGAMQITATGEEAILIAANAEAVSTSVTNETLTGTVDGSNKIFTTAHNGVGIFSDVSDNGISKRAGTDYTISQTNAASLPGTITFLVAPIAAHTIRGSYLYWKASQKFDDLVTSCLNQAGIAGANQQVSPVVFPSNIINTHTWQTQADWQGGSSLTNIDTTTLPNSIKVDYGSTAARSLTTWADSTSGWSAFGAISETTGYLTGTGFVGVDTRQAVRSSSTGTGRWEVTTEGLHTPGTTAFKVWAFGFACQDFNSGYTPTNPPVANGGHYGFYHGYCLRVAYESGSTGAPLTVYLNRLDGLGVNMVSLGTYSMTDDAGDHVWRIVRTPLGLITVYLDGTSILSATDLNYTTGSYLGFCTFGTALAPAMAKSGTLYVPAASIDATWISSALDFGATPTAWSQVLDAYVLSGASISFYTASSADNITYDSYVLVNVSGVNGSTLRRYLKAKIIITAALASNQDPSATNLTVGSITSSTVITLANFTGMTCYDAITALANFANYEFGFDANEKFFFRPKVPGNTPVFTLNESVFNLHVVSAVPGYDRVYSKIRATYAGYIKDVGDDGQNFAGPLPNEGYNMLEIDGGSILISSDADVATGIAGSFFSYYQHPRRRVKVQTVIIPQLDISDVIAVSFQDLFPLRWYPGDTSTYLGDATKSLYGPAEQPVPPMNMKLVGVRIDTNNWMTEFDFEEVI